MPTVRWFLAHAKTDEAQVGQWQVDLEATVLNTPGWTTQVTTGRSDYGTHAAAMVSWDRWTQDVPMRTNYLGEPTYHGVVFPYTGSLTTGRATGDIIAGFLRLGKHCFVWDTVSSGLYAVEKVAVVDRRSFTKHTEITLRRSA